MAKRTFNPFLDEDDEESKALELPVLEDFQEELDETLKSSSSAMGYFASDGEADEGQLPLEPGAEPSPESEEELSLSELADEDEEQASPELESPDFDLDELDSLIGELDSDEDSTAATALPEPAAPSSEDEVANGLDFDLDELNALIGELDSAPSEEEQEAPVEEEDVDFDLDELDSLIEGLSPAPPTPESPKPAVLEDDWGFDTGEPEGTSPSAVEDDWGFDSSSEDEDDEDADGLDGLEDLLNSLAPEHSEDKPALTEDWGFDTAAEPSEPSQEEDFFQVERPGAGASQSNAEPDSIDLSQLDSTPEAGSSQDWSFMDDPDEAETEGASPAPANWDELDFDDDEGYSKPEEEEEEFASWMTTDFEEGEESQVPPQLKKSGLAGELAVADTEEEKPDSAFKSKLRDTWAQIKSELKGGEEVVNGDEEPEKGEGAGSKILNKILTPYHLLAGLILKALLLVLSPFKKIPALSRFVGPSTPLRLLSYLIPVLLVMAFLQWQGSKPLPPPESYSFPDEGKASISEFNYDEDGNVAEALVLNEGPVIAKIRVEFEVESLQRNINPLSFFFAEPNPSCKSGVVTVPIGEEVLATAKCPIKGSFKKMTGGIVNE